MKLVKFKVYNTQAIAAINPEAVSMVTTDDEGVPHIFIIGDEESTTAVEGTFDEVTALLEAQVDSAESLDALAKAFIDEDFYKNIKDMYLKRTR